MREDSAWQVAAPAPDYVDRRVELGVAATPSMLAVAMRSGAEGCIASLQEAGERRASPASLAEATLASRAPVLLIRPRPLHVPERGLQLAAGPASASIVDTALYAERCAVELVAAGRCLYVDIPGLSHYEEARWWNDLMAELETLLGLPAATIRVRVGIETAQAAFQMDELLWELRERSIGLAAAPAAYLRSVLAGRRDEAPERAALTLQAPAVHAYLTRLLDTAHRRGAYAVGPEVPFLLTAGDDVPDRDAGAREDADWVATSGFDGVAVRDAAHVGLARERMSSMLGSRLHQMTRLADGGFPAGRDELLDLGSSGTTITEDVRQPLR